MMGTWPLAPVPTINRGADLGISSSADRGVDVSITVDLRRLLLPTAHVASLEDDVAVEAASVDLD
jgi:hypothetical protein